MAALSREEILEAVHQLSHEEQRALALEILQALASAPPPAPDPRSASVMALRGLAKTDEPINDARSSTKAARSDIADDEG